MYFVYILRSNKDGGYYVGCTNNIERRIREHNTGRSSYTKSDQGSWVLIYKEQYRDLSQARSRERQIKSWRKRAAIEKLINAAIV